MTTPDTRSAEHIGSYIGRTVPVVGYISEEPDVRLDVVRYTVQVNYLATKEKKAVTGNILLTSPIYPRYKYGDKLHFSCKLSWPESRDDFRYDLYLERFGIYATCGYPQFMVHTPRTKTTVFGHMLTFKEHLAERINRIWPEPYAGFMSGLLYGYRGGLGSLDESFRKTGLTHIVAVSGQNIMLVTTMMLWICFTMRIKRPYALTIALVGIILFVLFTGASASVVRAGCMGVLMILAESMGRGRNMRNVLVAVAGLMVCVEPRTLLYDPGFALSFLAPIGVIYTSPCIHEWLGWFPETLGLRDIMAVSLAATAWTIPFSAYQFGQISLLSPVANLLVLPVLPYLMLVGAIAVVGSLIHGLVGLGIGYVAYLFMRYVEGVVTWLAHLPIVSVEVTLPLIVPVTMYTLLCASLFLPEEKNSDV
jgi:competence protein ComEC